MGVLMSHCCEHGGYYAPKNTIFLNPRLKTHGKGIGEIQQIESDEAKQ